MNSPKYASDNRTEVSEIANNSSMIEPRYSTEPAYPSCPQDTSGAGQGEDPLEPLLNRPQPVHRDGKSAQPTRDRVVKVRVTEDELADFRARAVEADMTVSDLVRFRLLNFRLRQSSAEKERVRHLAMIGNNINQLARWANAHKAASALEVVLWLNRLLLGVRQLAGDDHVH